MEFKHVCKICDRKFISGKSMGGHMRSHLAKLPVQRKLSSPHPSGLLNAPNPSELLDAPKAITTAPFVNSDIGFLSLDSGYAQGSRAHFASSASGFSPTRELGVRTFARKRSNQTCPQLQGMQSAQTNGPQLNSKYGHFSSPDELVTVEDVALCLMMLSNDKWPEGVPHPKMTILSDSDDTPEENDVVGTDDDKDDDYDDSSESIDLNIFGHRCKTCKKVFKSYQALGGHMRNHKRIVTALAVEKGFPCNICLKVFLSAQALGGHKRVHSSTNKSTVGNPLYKNKDHIIKFNSDSEPDLGFKFASIPTSGTNETSSVDTDTYYNGGC